MLEDLKIKHREVARLSFEGFKAADISSRTGVSLATVYKILRDPLSKGYIAGLADRQDKTTLDVRERLMQLNSAALDAFDDILGADSKAPYSVIANVSKDVLDRTGNKAPDKIDINHTLQGKSDAEIDAQIAALTDQINNTYNADMTAGDEPDETDEPAELDDVLVEEAKINPVTDCKE